ncbi:DAZAP1 [Symbiodinium natans]|uniref:DAZAP1 protein n=1 Tax=Symbiodinium natans TaxID=878477 RepID=A0A812LVQ3_9DINO|nr:DAZAP1 [Symbiodinium natans]
MVRIPEKDPGEVAAAAAAAATADALAKVAAKQAEKAEATETPQAETTLATEEEPSSGKSVRFFIRGLGNLGEHHLRDYFQQFGTITEARFSRQLLRSCGFDAFRAGLRSFRFFHPGHGMSGPFNLKIINVRVVGVTLDVVTSWQSPLEL